MSDSQIMPDDWSISDCVEYYTDGMGKAITDQFYFAFIVIGIFFFVSLFAFMLNWNDIEKVHR